MPHHLAQLCRVILTPAILLAIAVLLSAADTPDKGAPKYTLRYKFQPGETVRMQVWDRTAPRPPSPAPPKPRKTPRAP